MGDWVRSHLVDKKKSHPQDPYGREITVLAGHQKLPCGYISRPQCEVHQILNDMSEDELKHLLLHHLSAERFSVHAPDCCDYMPSSPGSSSPTLAPYGHLGVEPQINFHVNDWENV